MNWGELELLCDGVVQLIPKMRDKFKNPPMSYRALAKSYKFGPVAYAFEHKLSGFAIICQHGWEMPSWPSLPYFQLLILVSSKKRQEMLRERKKEIQKIQTELPNMEKKLVSKMRRKLTEEILISKKFRMKLRSGTPLPFQLDSTMVKKQIGVEIEKAICVGGWRVFPPSDHVLLTFRLLPLEEKNKRFLQIQRREFDYEYARSPLAYGDLKNLIIIDETLMREEILLQMGIYFCREGVLGKEGVDCLKSSIKEWINNNKLVERKLWEIREKNQGKKTKPSACREEDEKEIYVKTPEGTKISRKTLPNTVKIGIPAYGSKSYINMIETIIKNFNIPRTAKTFNSYMLTLVDENPPENTKVADLAQALRRSTRTVYRWLEGQNYPRDRQGHYDVNDEIRWREFESSAWERNEKEAKWSGIRTPSFWNL